jgi:hypothetical protein
MGCAENWVQDLIDSHERLIGSIGLIVQSGGLHEEDRQALLEEAARGQHILQCVERRGTKDPVEADLVIDWEDRVYELSRLSLEVISKRRRE